MKKLHLLFGLILCTSFTSQAQVSVNINLGTPPVWAPAPAAQVETQYYYLPDVDAYYDVPSQRFIYVKNGAWIRSTSLPYQYRNYNLKGGNIVYLTDYRGNSPYVFHKNHKVKYPKKIKYVAAKGNNYVKGNGGNKNNNGHDKGHGKGKGHKQKILKPRFKYYIIIMVLKSNIFKTIFFANAIFYVLI
jgi:hypothetical protein